MTLKMIKDQAVAWMADPNFKGSKGWWRRAKRRLNVVTRIPTHVIQKFSDQSGNDIKLYLARLQQVKVNYALSDSE